MGYTTTDRASSFSLSSLLCQEDVSFLTDEDPDEPTPPSDHPLPFFLADDDDEYFEILVARETAAESGTPLLFNDSPDAIRSWLRSVRLDAVEWILKSRALFGFQFHTAYLSIGYFDRVLSIRNLQKRSWIFRLLAVGCLSLAAKMEESKTPKLSSLQVEGFDMESKAIQRMELYVLNTLDWRMSSVTPFSYLQYLIRTIFVDSNPQGLLSKAAKFIMSTVKEINLVDHRPSLIAAASLLASSDAHLTREQVELKLKAIASFGSLEYERIFFCYNLMLKTEKENAKEELTGTPSSSICTTTPNIVDNRSATSTSGTKSKRRLTFEDSDPDCPEKKIHRP
ncbi:cyclin-D5-1-like [Momordica charantia]|uniref:B-like cyclin n=1 Tax=Momordica charantia TaxID=3673 RepID=A0A6J1BVU5_MOMCH|nr:cyclin-D5-1-like [Momordica charantia]